MADKTQFLAPEQLAKNREEFLQVLRDNVKRDGLEDLITYLENSEEIFSESATKITVADGKIVSMHRIYLP